VAESRSPNEDPDIKASLSFFPCCVCGEGREVRTTKKGKPYMICDPAAYRCLSESRPGFGDLNCWWRTPSSNHVWQAWLSYNKRYQPQCPRCSKRFWLTPELLKTSWVNGKPEGYRCPDPAMRRNGQAGESSMRLTLLGAVALIGFVRQSFGCTIPRGRGAAAITILDER